MLKAKQLSLQPVNALKSKRRFPGPDFRQQLGIETSDLAKIDVAVGQAMLIAGRKKEVAIVAILANDLPVFGVDTAPLIGRTTATRQ